ncbi:hypothetical protein AAHC03_013265 [Spirometra sp. Aus1]
MQVVAAADADVMAAGSTCACVSVPRVRVNRYAGAGIRFRRSLRCVSAGEKWSMTISTVFPPPPPGRPLSPTLTNVLIDTQKAKTSSCHMRVLLLADVHA